MSLAGSRSKGLSELNHIGLIIPVITDLKLEAKGKPFYKRLYVMSMKPQER